MISNALIAAATDGGGAAAEKIADRICASGDETTHRREGLRERTHDEIDFILDPEMLRSAAPQLTEYADTVGVIHHQPSAVALLDFDDFWKLRDVSLHRKDAVDDDELAFVVGDIGQLLLEICHVVVQVFVGLAEGQPAAVDQARVVEAVGQRDVRALQQARENAEIDLETRREREHVLASQKLCESFFEFEVDVERAVEQPRARAAGSEHGEGHRSGFLHLWVVGEPEVVVRAQHDEFFAEVRDDRILPRRNGAVIGIDPSVSNLRVILRGISALLENVHSITSVEPGERVRRSSGRHPHIACRDRPH